MYRITSSTLALPGRIKTNSVPSQMQEYPQWQCTSIPTLGLLPNPSVKPQITSSQLSLDTVGFVVAL
jgi:hypothetical protein